MFKTYPPAKILQPYVSFFYTIKWERQNYKNGIYEMSLPSGTGFMVFQYAGRFYGTINNTSIVPPKFYTIGQQTHKYTLISDDEVVELTGAAMTPTGLYRLFGLDMPSMVNNPVDTKTIISEELVIFTKMYESTTLPQDRVDCIEKLLIEQSKGANAKPNIVDSSIDLIQKAKGCDPIQKIAKQLHISERYFQKKFKEIVGIPPSVFNRIVRFNYLFSELGPDAPRDYKSLSDIFSYYDYAHFSKDFKRYCGESPSTFHLEQFQFLKEAFVDQAFQLKIDSSQFPIR